jgi:ubiquinone/menaquinone biosynthesis C-methylase UbiE
MRWLASRSSQNLCWISGSTTIRSALIGLRRIEKQRDEGEAALANEEISLFRRIWSQGNYHKLAVEHQIASEQLVSEAVVRAGQKVLDLACGTGNTAIAAARRHARVTASDIVPELIQVARARAEAEGLDGIEYYIGDSSETIAFPDGSFDMVLSSFGASFFPDHQRAIDEMLRVTRPGGTIGLTLWAEASLPSDFFRAGHAFEASTAMDKLQPAFFWGNGSYLRQKLRSRSSAIRIVSGSFESCFTSFEAYVESHVKYHPPAILRMAAYNEEQRERYKQMLRTIAERYNRATDGTAAIYIEYQIVIITKV